MNQKELALIKEVYQDCISLQKQRRLTEQGKGQLMVCETLLMGCRKEFGMKL